MVTFRILDGVNQDSGNGRDIGNCPNPTSYPTANATMDPDPGIYNALTVPNNLKCFNSGECHICKPGNAISLDTNFNCPNVAIPIRTIMNGEKKTYYMRTFNENGLPLLTGKINCVPVPLNPVASTTDISNGCLIENEGNNPGIMQICKETTKTDLVKYNECQKCSKQFYSKGHILCIISLKIYFLHMDRKLILF